MSVSDKDIGLAPISINLEAKTEAIQYIDSGEDFAHMLFEMLLAAPEVVVVSQDFDESFLIEEFSFKFIGERIGSKDLRRTALPELLHISGQY